MFTNAGPAAMAFGVSGDPRANVPDGLANDFLFILGLGCRHFDADQLAAVANVLKIYQGAAMPSGEEFLSRQ